MIKSGLNKLIVRGYDWPPSAPEFSKLCRPSIDDFDVPGFDDAVEMIGRFDRSNSVRLDPFTYTMYLRMSKRMYDIRRMNERDYRNEMRRYYDSTAKALVSGAEMQVQPELLESKPPDPKPIVDSEGKFEDLKRSLE